NPGAPPWGGPRFRPAGGVKPRGRPVKPPRPPKNPPVERVVESPETKLGPAPGKTPWTAALSVVADQAVGPPRNAAAARDIAAAATSRRVRPDQSRGTASE